MKNFIILTTFLACLCYKSANAQDSLKVFGETMSNGLMIHWQVKDANQWAKLLSVGYQVERTELESGEKMMLSPKIMPEVRSVLAEQGEFYNPVVEMLGYMLYEKAIFSNNGTLLVAANELRYNYLRHEIQTDPFIAMTVGFGIMDSSLVEGKSYQYLIKSLDNSQVGILEIQNEFGVFIKNKQTDTRTYLLPNNQTLSDWAQIWKDINPPILDLKGSGNGNKVWLNWTPQSVELWKNGLKDGYLLERQDVEGNTKNFEVIKPSLAQTNDVYSKLVTVIIKKNQKAIEPIYEAWHYNLCLFASQKSKQAATVLGWNFMDSEVTNEMYYNYTIKPVTEYNAQMELSTSVSFLNEISKLSD